MKNLSALIQAAALAICFATHLAAADSIAMPGVRKAMQTIAAASASIQPAPGSNWSAIGC